jgi:O-antigen/teichoic acid export membrane protein
MLDSEILKNIDWWRPFASTYFRSAGAYLVLKLVVFSLAGLVGQYLLTHFLRREDYGLLVWAGTIIALLSPFGLSGISTSIVGAVTKGFDGNFRRGTWLEILGGTLGGLVLLGFSGYYRYWTHEETKSLVFLVAGVLGPGLWLDTHICYWNGKKNFKAIFWWSVPVRLLQLAAIALVFNFSSNPVLVFGVQSAIQVLANIAAPISIMRYSNANRNVSEDFQIYGNFTNWLYLAGSVSAYLDKLIIGIFFGLESLAIFSVGELVYTYFYKTPASMLSQIFMPRLAEMDLREAARWVRKRQPYLVLMIIVLMMVLAIVVPVIYPLLFSAKYKDSIYYCNLFLICIVLGAPTFLSGAILKSHAMKKETLRSWLFLAVTPLALLPIFGFYFGLAGLVMAKGGTNLVISTYYFFLIRKLSVAA